MCRQLYKCGESIAGGWAAAFGELVWYIAQEYGEQVYWGVLFCGGVIASRDYYRTGEGWEETWESMFEYEVLEELS